jgi:hypothetical protein
MPQWGQRRIARCALALALTYANIPSAAPVVSAESWLALSTSNVDPLTNGQWVESISESHLAVSHTAMGGR